MRTKKFVFLVLSFLLIQVSSCSEASNTPEDPAGDGNTDSLEQDDHPNPIVTGTGGVGSQGNSPPDSNDIGISDGIPIPLCPELEQETKCHDVRTNGIVIEVPNPRQGLCCQRLSNEGLSNPSLRISQLQITEPGFLMAYDPYLVDFINIKEASNLLVEIDLNHKTLRMGSGVRNHFIPNEEVTYTLTEGNSLIGGEELDCQNAAFLDFSIHETDQGTLLTTDFEVVNLIIPFFENSQDATPSVELPLYSLRIVRALLTENMSCVGFADGNIPLDNGRAATHYCGTRDSTNGILDGFILAKHTEGRVLHLNGFDIPLCELLNGLHPCDRNRPSTLNTNAVCTEDKCHMRAKNVRGDFTEPCTLDGQKQCAWYFSAVFSASAVKIAN